LIPLSIKWRGVHPEGVLPEGIHPEGETGGEVLLAMFKLVETPSRRIIGRSPSPAKGVHAPCGSYPPQEED